MGAFILHNLVKVAKITTNNVIMGGWLPL